MSAKCISGTFSSHAVKIQQQSNSRDTQIQGTYSNNGMTECIISRLRQENWDSKEATQWANEPMSHTSNTRYTERFSHSLWTWLHSASKRWIINCRKELATNLRRGDKSVGSTVYRLSDGLNKQRRVFALDPTQYNTSSDVSLLQRLCRWNTNLQENNACGKSGRKSDFALNLNFTSAPHSGNIVSPFHLLQWNSFWNCFKKIILFPPFQTLH